jgi:arylsulfatase A-like enzyme
MWDGGPEEVERPSFRRLGDRVYLATVGEGDPPEHATLRLYAEHEIRDDHGTPRLSGPQISADGISVWPGESREVALALPEHGALRFATVFEAALVPVEARVAYTVTLDDIEIFRHELVADAETVEAWHEVPLPRGGGKARLRFGVSGDFAYTGFASPTVGPAATGTYGQRPWEGRPDLVVFLADTFRADNLAAYGGPPDLTPRLNALAERALCLTRYRAVGTWTLPTHATMFTGLFPGALGSPYELDCVLPRDVPTLAESLKAHGYRTGAITDGLIVSKGYGLDEGFAWFDERWHDVESTLARARAFLAADDGRPVFLFVHTYAAHGPYEPSPEARKVAAAHFDARADDTYGALNEELQAVAPADPDGLGPAGEIVGRIEGLYRAGAVDLDRAFAGFEAELERTGVLDQGYLVFTSDHGESFGGQRQLYHGGQPFEGQVRVPLLVFGARVTPRMDDRPASQVDLAPTLLALAGLPRPDGWPGSSLFDLPAGRPQFAFGGAAVAIVADDQKLLYLPKPTTDPRLGPGGAFDLGTDPRESRDLSDEASWPAELRARLGAAAEEALQQHEGPRREGIESDRLDALRAVGYGGH